MNVGDTARINRGPWRGFSGRVTALFNGFTAVQLAGFERTFSNDELDDREHRIVTTVEFGDVRRHRCLDCGATRAGVEPPQPPCPGVTT